MANSWAVAVTHVTHAPVWLAIAIPAVFNIVCGVRAIHWFRMAGKTVTPEVAHRELSRTNVLAVVISIGFVTWSFSLFQYGDAHSKSHVCFYMAITVISCIFCLMYLRSAAVMVTIVVNGAFIAFFASTGEPTFIAIAINILLVCMCMLWILSINYHNFAKMIRSQEETQSLSDANFKLANLDSLTELPNRRAFLAYLHASLETSRANATRLAMGIIDLDGFKPVNDLYGHSTGDRLLIAVGKRLSNLGTGKQIYLSRLGGDEFAFVISDADSEQAILESGNSICAALHAPFDLSDSTVVISGTVGISVFPDTSATAEQLFDCADYALFHGKRWKRGSSTLFTTAHHDLIHRDARIEQALKRIDLQQELSVVFQPIVTIDDGRPVGFEALARWTNPALGQVSPDQFIPVAERAGIVNTLTQHLLKASLAYACQWPAQLRLSFNLSAHDLNSAESVLSLVTIIRKSSFAASRLDLELTETAFAHDFEQVRQSVDMLRMLGCGIVLDDFGTGYSSLTQLHALPLTKIKIDRSFVTGLHDAPASYKIVKSLLTLSGDMGLDCVIEGVETECERAALQQLGASFAQGYFYSPPLAADQVFDFIRAADLATPDAAVIDRDLPEGADLRPFSHPVRGRVLG